MNELDKALDSLKEAILTRTPKKQEILTKWLQKWATLIRCEESFREYRQPNLPRYKRGDILCVEYGFNVGTEYGGMHYAVVMEENNNKSSGQIVVVPLSSRELGDKLYTGDVFLGAVINEKSAVAKPNQIRAISKMRIKKKMPNQLNREQLCAIEIQLKEFLRLGVDKR